MGGVIVIVIVVALLLTAVVYAFKAKDENDKSETDSVVAPENAEENEHTTMAETEHTMMAETDPVKQAIDNDANIQSGAVITIAGIALIVSIIASIICFAACANEHNDTLQLVLGILGGYVLLQGLILFGVLYGIGHILRHNEEMDETTKEISETNKAISEKMDKIIEKL